MRRKGKPKAKTKPVSCVAPKSTAAIDCDTDQASASNRFQLAPAGANDFERHTKWEASGGAPLISVSIASAGPSSRSVSIGSSSSSAESVASDQAGPPAQPAQTSPQDELAESASSDLVAATTKQAQTGDEGQTRCHNRTAADIAIKTCDSNKSAKSNSNCVVVFDSESQTSQTLIDPGLECDDERDNTCAINDDNHQHGHLSNGIELVKQSYIKLMARNNLYYFYLGALLYSVINMIYLLTFAIRARLGGAQTGGLGSRLSTQTPLTSTDSTNCDNFDGRQLMRDFQNNVWLLLACLFGVTILQVVVIALEFYIVLKQQQNNYTTSTRSDGPNSTRTKSVDRAEQKSEKPKCDIVSTKTVTSLLDALHLKLTGIVLSLLIMVLPIGVLHFLDQHRHCNVQRPAPLPIILVSSIVYILPNLVNEPENSLSRWQRRLFIGVTYLIVMLPLVFAMSWSQRWTTQSSLHNQNSDQLELEMADLRLTLVMMLVALLAGCFARRLREHVHLVATFKKANELIEAKVSLEQQRQQQETLLLSVLPAYVAEQVKRNMLKKMDTTKEGDQEFGCNQQDSCSTSIAPPSVAFGHHSDVTLPGLVSTHATTAAAALQARSFTLPSNCDAPPSSPSHQSGHGNGNQLESEKRQVVVTNQFRHRSFTKKLRLGSSFASSYLTTSKSPPSTSVATVQQQNQTNSDQAAGFHQQQQQPVGVPQFVTPSSTSGGQQSRRGFNELYIRTYNNVSLLYGDIVGFTRLCTQLSSSQLVQVLNNLFSYFDYLAEQHKIMRIKILGDCYYGVSGIPEFAVLGAKSSTPRHKTQTGGGAGKSCLQTSSAVSSSPFKSSDNHAINCVNMGLDMIQYIKCLNFERAPSQTNASSRQGHHSQLALDSAGTGAGSLPANFELNMRIGIHTGHIHSGVIGLKKWQFDVWSNDVSIAMHCESSGVAGRVQVTEATIQHLRNAFTFEPATRSSRDTFLADRSIRTYLIVDRVLSLNSSWGAGLSINSRQSDDYRQQTTSHMIGVGANQQTRKASNNSAKTVAGGSCSYSFAPSEIQEMDEGRIREATIGTIRQTLLSGEPNHTAGGFSGGRGSLARLDHNDMSWWTLEFNDSTLNGQFNSRPISTMGYLRELGVLFLLLAVLVQTINYDSLKRIDATSRQSQHNHHQTLNSTPNTFEHETLSIWKLVILASFVITFTLAVAALPKRNRTASKGVGGASHQQRRSFLDTKRSSSILNNPVHWWRQSQSSRASASAPTENNILDGHDFTADNHHQPNWFSFEPHNKFSRSLDQLLCRTRNCAHRWLRLEREAINRVGLYAIWATFLFVILFQFYLMKREFCLHVRDSTTNAGQQYQQMKHWHQTIVLVLVLALDLSPSLLTYRLRSTFLIGLALVQLVLLCVTLNPIRRPQVVDATGNSTSGGGGESLFQQLLAVSRLMSSLCGNKTVPSTWSPGTNVQDQEQFISIISQHLIDWSGDALLLVLIVWSLVANRQLEYSQRANFLWRNRLNVDHEELEYISGINKVLLENILPSHVVQHYLDQPMVATSGAGRDSQTPMGPIAGNDRRLSSSTNSVWVDQERQQQQQQQQQQATTTTGQNCFGTRKASQAIAGMAGKAQLMRVGMGCQMRRNLHAASVASHNLNGAHELYHEQHDSVAVMFASIPHFYEFYDESDISKQGLGCIALLNEIICDFDKLLLKNKFSRIEKIKTIGSTYMAAAGLRPSLGGLASGRNSNASITGQHQHQHQQGACNLGGSSTSPILSPGGHTSLGADLQGDKRLVLSQQKMNLICMIQFATSLMSALNGINKQSFQVFKLRVGVNTGPVVAGIIGAQRPFYDIWGDCVNIASRMESLGEVGRIQVEERTAKLLTECLCPETYSIEKRGPIDVKGKGGMVTYFVDKRQPQTQQQQQQQQQQPQQSQQERICPEHESSDTR